MKNLSAIWISLAVSLSTLGGYHYIVNRTNQVESRAKMPVSFTSDVENSQKWNNLPTDFTGAAAKAMPAVVHIKSTQTVQVYDPWSDFFGWGFGGRRGNGTQKSESSGSGVIVNKEGYIVTNNHVIKDAQEVTVTLYDNRTFKAKVIGTDPSTDLGVIQIQAEHLQAIKFTNSDEAKVGQWVIAVGNPFNLSSTVTAGIVSAIGRNLEIINDKTAIESFIQTDAAVNPGNSGGALVDLEGDLVGINTAISSPTGAYAGYAFAVPSNIVNKIVEDLIAYGTVQRAYLGLGKITILNNVEAEKNDLKIEDGILIQTLNANGSAANSGLKAGDVITAVDGLPVKNEAKLNELIGRHRPGDKVKLNIHRDGKNETLEVLLRNQQGTTAFVKRNETLQKLGMDVVAAPDNLRRQYGIDYGVQVSSLYAGKIRQATDIQSGWVILEVNGQKVSSPEEVAAIIEENGGEKVSIQGFQPNVYINGQVPVKKYELTLD